MILRPLYAPFIDVFGGDLLDQLLASEEGQGHVSAVSVLTTREHSGGTQAPIFYYRH